ncbi:tetratricopeptide repeat protein [Patiriisocius marinus]|uniref:tetratricopeptide repeat protein n=1 Tax=Patiriisocius marinus TaxID=1397112 RepID=UPI00232FB63A|nr:tetratricopeptide repeat protein [Patiriisocius marinus]
MKRKNSFWEELKRRNVVKGAISYIVVAWLLIRIAALLGDILEMPIWITKSLFFLLLIFFPIWLLLSWIYEITPNGLKKTKKVEENESIRKKTSKRLNKIIIAVLVMVLIVLVVDRFFITGKVSKTKNNKTEFVLESKTIAVLPFKDFSSEKDNEYFVDGLTEELLNLLSQVPNLKVTSRTSTFSFKNSDLQIPEITSKLNVKYLLEGSVRKSESQLRITAQLIEAETDKHLWSKTFDRTIDNVFVIQDEVAEEVVKALEISLLEAKPLPKSTKTNPEAYKLYLQGVHASHFSSSVSKLNEAISYSEQALAIDESYIPAWLLLSRLYETKANSTELSFEEGYTKAKQAANNVLKIDPTNALAYAYLADYSLSYDWDFEKAKQLNAIALKLDSKNPVIINLSATLAIALGNIESSIRLQEYSASLDPINPDTYYYLSNIYYYADRLEDAANAARKCIEMNPNRYAIHYYYTRILLQQNNIDEARKAIKAELDDGWSLQMLSDIHFKLNELDTSEMYMQQLFYKYTNEMAYQIAESYSFRNDKENAFKWLEKAYDVHDVGLNEILAEPRFRNLHNDKRWNKFIDKMGFPKTTNND